MFNYLLSTVVIFTSLCLHPIHVSICEIEYDRNNKALETTMRIFLDDLEKGIRSNKGNPDLDLTDLPQGINLDELIKSYLAKNFKVSVNSKTTAYNYLGHEIEGDAVFCYLEITKVKKLKSIKIYNATLTDLYEDQTNLVHIEVDEKIRSMKLTRFQKEDEITYIP